MDERVLLNSQSRVGRLQYINAFPLNVTNQQD